MKLLLCTDMHGNMLYLDKLKQLAKQVDVVICAGDFTQFEHNIDVILKHMNGWGKQVLLIHGNHEDNDSVRKLIMKMPFLFLIHDQPFQKRDVTFYGWGGGGFNMSDPSFAKRAEQHFQKSSGKRVLVIHGPPYNTIMDNVHEGHVGNKSYTEIIKKYQPNLVVCGHIHETFGTQDKIGKSIIINPGPKGKIIEL
ncbi:MAG: metallophosphoesterase family protein [archaeon]